ncbi:hypothetical protein FSP39_015448 [Pinctada imbricata]|uniref:Uncharacterized protein n=1 Tax=Pinctada imbricata TaxID=66713 RepID=A0AA89C7I1_PINIB|nr:hypothetical protein FSP39_015448 [Pinctada imbricata]
MDANQYMEFSNARRVSLGKRYRSQRFREWLLHGVNVDIKPSQQSIEIFSYMAYETIAQIVDFALIVKQDLRAISGDVMTKALPPVTTNIQDMSVINPTSTTSSKPSPGLTSPSQSPPTTPTSAGLSSSTGLLGGSSGASASSKNKAKKRKKSSYGSSIDMITSQAIQPQEIHEAIRRYSQMIGPFSSVVVSLLCNLVV